MTPVTLAYRRWLAAEQDVHDARGLQLWAIETGEASFERRQMQVVNLLRSESSKLLREYRAKMTSEVQLLDHRSHVRPLEVSESQGEA